MPSHGLQIQYEEAERTHRLIRALMTLYNGKTGNRRQTWLKIIMLYIGIHDMMMDDIELKEAEAEREENSRPKLILPQERVGDRTINWLKGVQREIEIEGSYAPMVVVPRYHEVEEGREEIKRMERRARRDRREQRSRPRFEPPKEIMDLMNDCLEELWASQDAQDKELDAKRIKLAAAKIELDKREDLTSAGMSFPFSTSECPAKPTNEPMDQGQGE